MFEDCCPPAAAPESDPAVLDSAASANLEREAQKLGQCVFAIPEGYESATVNAFVSAIIGAAVARTLEVLE